MKVSIVGGSGYVGGELLRILLGHPKVDLSQVASSTHAGKPVWKAHPNLRRVTDISFCDPEELKPADALMIATPHTESMKRMKTYRAIFGKVVDLSADFRLKDLNMFRKYYATDHASPELLDSFVYGLPELHRDEIAEAAGIAVPGCVATVSILALWPLVNSGIVDTSRVIIDAKTGSSAGGSQASRSSHHAERSGSIRAYAVTGHRHTAEIEMELSVKALLSIHAVDLVRGILCTCYSSLRKDVDDIDVWRIYRDHYGKEPFVRIVKETSGIHRFPDPKILSGSNFCDLGFAIDQERKTVAVIGAIDNLMKGAAGNAVQCLNTAFGIDETTGLQFPGLHPA